MSQMQDSNLRQSVLQYLNQTAAGLDKNANSKTLIETLARESVHNHKSTALWKSRTKKSVAVGVVAVVLAITVQFLVNYFSNELSKESHVDKQGAMVSTDGNVVKTQMEEMKVDADGKLLSRNGAAAVKTMPSLAKVALASSLPDATLMALDEITVHSDKGYTLQIKVHGFSRVPVLNSRCGNVVHFYTAWKGKVTLDSTDLSFDEATAAEFENSGFSLATGGRRLAGKITLDGFAKALDGMRESGKWTCADVPLPTFSNLGDRQETNYSPCGGTRRETDGICFSMYGGLKIGVTALEGSLAAAVTSHTDRLTGKQTEKLFVKSSSAVMNSDLYRVSFSEYAMHPGQQLVAISDVASGKVVEFQMETDQTRSRCVASNDEMQKIDQKARKSDKIDDEWHFEYLGTNEEDGRVLRHFRIMFSSEYTEFIFGDASKASLPNFAEFWDVAETMQPHRLILGGDGITEFGSYKIVSDSDVQAAVETRTGKTIAELMECSVEEATQFTDRPKMDLYSDLLGEDANYYKASSSTKSETWAQYLDATGNPYAMPDMCYEKCKLAVDAVKKVAGTDICEGAALASALGCLSETELAACQSSVFVNEHFDECGSNDTVRTLENLEESEDASELLVNESRSLFMPITPSMMKDMAKSGKNLWDVAKEGKGKRLSNTDCESKKGSLHFHFKVAGDRTGVATCARWDLKKWGFHLEIGWMKLVASWKGFAMWISLEACANVSWTFGLPPFLSIEKCLGGSIEFTSESECPDVQGLYIFGKAWASLDCGMDFWVMRISFAKLEVGFRGGMGWYDVAKSCWWRKNEGGGRRRWWTRRRRDTRKCHYKKQCDIYIKGYVKLTILCIRGTVEFVYWTKNKVFDISIKLEAWAWKWHEACKAILYRKKYR